MQQMFHSYGQGAYQRAPTNGGSVRFWKSFIVLAAVVAALLSPTAAQAATSAAPGPQGEGRCTQTILHRDAGNRNWIERAEIKNTCGYKILVRAHAYSYQLDTADAGLNWVYPQKSRFLHVGQMYSPRSSICGEWVAEPSGPIGRDCIEI